MTTPRTTQPLMDPDRRATLLSGLFYMATFVFSIPALWLYHGVVDDPGFVLGSGGHPKLVLWGALIEVITGLTGIGTAAVLYPILKRHAPGRAVGFVVSRTLEAAMIFTGVLAVLAVYTLRQDYAGAADTASLTTTASALVAVKNWSFLFGPGIMPAVNALCFATILHRTRLVPRWIPTLGLIGGPVLAASSIATLFGAYGQVSSIATLTALPIAVWEFSVGVYMLAKGFRSPAVAGLDDRAAAADRPAGLVHV